MLEPREKGMVATTLHYGLIAVPEFRRIEMPDLGLQDVLRQLAVVEMLKRKQAGMPIERQPEAAAPTNVVNLMVALRRSVEAEKPATARVKASERKKTAKEPERRVC